MSVSTYYRPKFCRTRGCSLPFKHDGSHDGAPTGVRIPVTPRPAERRKGRRIAGTYRRVAR